MKNIYSQYNIQIKMLNALMKRFINYQPNVEIDQVVSLVFKNVQTQPLSILFLQRNYHPKDLYSGDLCFPGGHRQKGQSLLDTAIRQTLQQTALDLNKKGRYLGTLDHQFFTKKGKSKHAENKQLRTLYLSVLMFEINENVSFNLDTKQIRDYKWIPLQQFFDKNTQNLTFKNKKYKLYMKENEFEHEIDYVQFSSLNIGMEADLWGLTFIIMTYLLRQLRDMEVEQFGLKVSKDHLNQLFEHHEKITIIYDKQTKKMVKPLLPFRKAVIEGRFNLKPKL